MTQDTQGTAFCERCGTRLGSDAPAGLCPKCLLELNLATQTEEPRSGEEGAEPGNGLKQETAPRQQPPPLLDEVRRHFPQFEVMECLGRGGMGVVYKARQPRLNRLVAIKILAREREKEARFAERFTREAQALARLNHPNIVTVYDFGETNGLYYLLMEYVDGMSLRQLLQARKLAPAEALAIVPHICDALQYAHEQGIVHRDIKPENLLLDKQGRVKIADFGIAKLLREPPASTPANADAGKGETAPATGPLTQDQVMGTPSYMAPEQVERPAEVDHRADIYSLGVVFYEMLTGELPLGKFAPPSRRVNVDVRLDEVVLHALEKEPERRYQHASEVKSDVETISRAEAGGGHKTAPLIASSPAAVPPQVPAPARRSGAWKVVLTVAACLLLLLAIPLGLFVMFLGLRVSSARRPAQATVMRTPQGPRLTVAGKVTDLVTGSPITGARVNDAEGGPVQQAWTDSVGRYRLRTWENGQRLAFSASGYEATLAAIPASTDIVGNEKRTELNVQLAPLKAGSTNLAEAELLRESVRRGKKAWQQGDYATAFALLLPAALRGDPVAQHRVGVMYTLGQGVTQDVSEATRWYRKAAEQGQGEAQYSLGIRYTFGQSVAQDHEEAHRWYLQAAEQGIGAAAAAVARQYARGEGVAKDGAEAYKWALIASKQDDPNDGRGLVQKFSERLSPEEVAEGQRRASDFTAKRTAPADP